jgi:Protein of unknown function (DUF2752)
MLLVLAAGLVLVFAAALWIKPYDGDGQPLRQEAHRQLGLPPCKFYEMFGKPCPSCGLTTSFSLLMHGDVGASLRANPVGTLLAAFCLALIPWSVLVALRGRYFWVRSLERASLWAVGVFMVLLLIRWAIVFFL